MGLTKRQKKAWEEFGKEEGANFVGLEEIPLEFGPVEGNIQKLKAVDITRKGGYEELPEKLITEAARQVGLDQEDIPRIIVEEADMASVSSREGETVVIIPRRLNKKRLLGTLVHELTHYKLGHQPSAEETFGEHFVKELQADKMSGGRVGTSELIDRIFSAVDAAGLSWKDAIDIITHAAREVGVSETIIRRAKRWVHNYVDRYGLDLDEGRFW